MTQTVIDYTDMMRAREAVGLPAGDPTDYGLPIVNYSHEDGPWPKELRLAGAFHGVVAACEPWVLAATCDLIHITHAAMVQESLFRVMVPAVLQLRKGLDIARNAAFYVPASAHHVALEALEQFMEIVRQDYGEHVKIQLHMINDIRE